MLQVVTLYYGGRLVINYEMTGGELVSLLLYQVSLSAAIDVSQIYCYDTSVKPLNKGHFGDNINSAVLSFMERVSSSRRFSIYWNYRESNFGSLSNVLYREVTYSVPFSEGPLSEVPLYI